MSGIPVVVIGAGQAGLAVSWSLTASGVPHVVLDRGRIADRWASHPWESLRLLSPNWLSRLPGFRYTGPDPGGFMPAASVAAYLRSYAAAFAAPVVAGAEVLSVRPRGGRYEVTSTAGTWAARAVVVATGWCDVPAVPALAGALDPRIAQVTPATYRNPQSLPDGRVLVVGASATGAQIADELTAAGRPVVLAAGSHSRVPRRYRGRDIMWWLDAMGVLDRRLDEHPRPAGTRREPSLQLAGNAGGRDVDLWSLQRRGVVLAGRLVAADRRRVRFAGDLPFTTAAADLRLRRLRHRIDRYAAANGLADGTERPGQVLAARTDRAVERLDLRRDGVGSVVWATGYRRAYPWLHVPVLDRAGEIVHTGGSTPAPGLYVVGMRWQSRRNSTFLDGVRHDAAAVTGRVLRHLGAAARPRDGRAA
ncbi:flavin-containing monooxygenase [Actinoplanes sp. CA-030573]|uniref:flavin-containing monooxygenase n=1 Tax=Actinoplanes sp. CA-030573 TaxID=3239898 RepID=UPI003D8ABFBF